MPLLPSKERLFCKETRKNEGFLKISLQNPLPFQINFVPLHHQTTTSLTFKDFRLWQGLQNWKRVLRHQS
jgi:hypothetical protein